MGRTASFEVIPVIYTEHAWHAWRSWVLNMNGGTFWVPLSDRSAASGFWISAGLPESFNRNDLPSLGPPHSGGGNLTGDFASIIFRPTLNDVKQMRLPQELVEHIIDCLSGDHKTLKTCSLVATTWLARSRHHLFNSISLNNEKATKWCSAIRPGTEGISRLVRTLALRQAPGHRWLGTAFLDTIPDHFSSFRHVENLSVSWLVLGDFNPESLGRHFVHYGPSLRSLRLSYLSADYSSLMVFLQLFPYLEDLLIHTPDLCDDSPPERISRTAPSVHGFLNLLSFDSASSQFVSHLAGLDLQFSSISVFNCDFLSGSPLNNLLEASSSTLRSLELEYITFCKNCLLPFLASRSSIHFSVEYTSVSLVRCENLQDVTAGTFEEGRPLSLLLSLLSTLSPYHLTHFTIDFVAMPSLHWPEWKTVDAHLLQMAGRCGLRERPRVVLRTRLGMPSDVVEGHQLLPRYCGVGPVELRLNARNQPSSR